MSAPIHTEPGDITADDIVTEMKRELGMRSSVYPRLVNEQKLTHVDAAHRMAVCRRLILEYERKAAAEAGQGELSFGSLAPGVEIPNDRPKAKPMVARPNPGADGGKPGPWRRALEGAECPKCKSPIVQYREVVFDEEQMPPHPIGTQLMCLNTVCYHVWWVSAVV